MSVIVKRPSDVRDGLKPVLPDTFGMNSWAVIVISRSKSARIVGEK
jgi:DNA gyrase/topoisomerase IV subunit A